MKWKFRCREKARRLLAHRNQFRKGVVSKHLLMARHFPQVFRYQAAVGLADLGERFTGFDM